MIKIKLKNKSILLLFVVFALLLFLNFHNIYLWSDEASTSLLGRNTLKYGYPKAFDGKNWVSSPINPTLGISIEGQEHIKSDVWTIHSWLQYYVPALSLGIFGQTTFAARFPFVLFGFASLFLIWHLFNMLYPDKSRKTALLAMLILLSTTFFFTFSRQARYHTLLLFFSMGLLISYINLLKREKIKDIIYFSICGIFLFHSNYFSFFLTFLTLSIHFAFFSKVWKKKLNKMAVSFAAVITFTLPWFIYAQPWKFLAGESSAYLNLYTTFSFLLRSLNFHYPLILLLVLPFLLLKTGKKAKGGKKAKKSKKAKNDEEFSDKLILIFLLAPFIAMLFFKENKFRYMFGFVPLFCLLCSRAYFVVKKNSKTLIKVLALIVLVLLMFSNILSLLPLVILNNPFVVNTLDNACLKFAPVEKHERCEKFVTGTFRSDKIKFPIFYYIYEITHDYNGPNEGESLYLNEHGTEDDLVYAYYGYLPLQFYTKMKILDPSLYNLSDENVQPDWIIPRWKGDYPVNELEQYAIENNYKKIELPYPDIYWENRPSIYLHRFWTPTNVQNVIIYQKQ